MCPLALSPTLAPSPRHMTPPPCRPVVPNRHTAWPPPRRCGRRARRPAECYQGRLRRDGPRISALSRVCNPDSYPELTGSCATVTGHAAGSHVAVVTTVATELRRSGSRNAALQKRGSKLMLYCSAECKRVTAACSRGASAAHMYSYWPGSAE